LAELLLGPLLRYANSSEATVWVETSAPCEVEVLGSRVRTFSVWGHHYALVYIEGLEPGSAYEYEVRLDGERRWPEPDSRFPPSVIRPLEPGGDLRLAFGSCRVAVPHYPPYTLTKDEDPEGRETDALYALALKMRREPPEQWPHVLMLLGDQIYADEAAPATREFIRARRDVSEPPGEEAADFEEYAHLYRESWSLPEIRWLLSTVSSAMIFDDHEVQDNWNGSHLWLEENRRKPWWEEKVAGALSTYWIYQHLGNLSPADLEEEGFFRKVREASDPGAVLREMSLSVAVDPEAYRWSFYRDLGHVRLVVLDSRAGRVLKPGRRRMIHAPDWDWAVERASGDFDHLLFATSIPLLLGPGLHHAEAWNDALCNGAWGKPAARLSERLREAENLGHWSAFPVSFERFADLLRSVATGERGAPPASIAVLSGDVHHAYLAKVSFPAGTPVRSPVYQAVCSPFRNPLDKNERRSIRFAWSRVGKGIFRVLARAAGAQDPQIEWFLTHEEPWFNNQVATLELSGRRSRMRLERTIPGDDTLPRLETVFEYELSG
jgi:hypothetical protein